MRKAQTGTKHTETGCKSGAEIRGTQHTMHPVLVSASDECWFHSLTPDLLFLICSYIKQIGNGNSGV